MREWEGKGMLSRIPINLEKVKSEDLDKEILRAGIITELDAINLYEKMGRWYQNLLVHIVGECG